MQLEKREREKEVGSGKTKLAHSVGGFGLWQHNKTFSRGRANDVSPAVIEIEVGVNSREASSPESS